MQKKNRDKERLNEIREVVKDWNANFEIVAHRSSDGNPKGQIDRLEAEYAVLIIEDILNRKASALTRDYRKTKADNLKAAGLGLK